MMALTAAPVYELFNSSFGAVMKYAWNSLILGILILCFGTLGYMLIEGSSFLDSLYMTVITITTVGFSEVVQLSPAGKFFTMILILVGVGFVLYVFGKITETVVEGGLQAILGRINLKKKVAKVKNHFIVCGFGRIGKVICKILHENNRPFVVIENNPDEIPLINDLGYLVLEGEASDDEVLIEAGVKKARGLICVASSDASNVYITLTARGLNPDLFILARSSGEEGAEKKLLRSGADKVISPYFIGACRMAQFVVRPTVTDFIDLTVGAGQLGLRMEELTVSERAKYANIALQDSGIRQKYDLIVVAIKRKDGEMLFNPTPQTITLPGDTLIVLGEHDHIKEFEKEL